MNDKILSFFNVSVSCQKKEILHEITMGFQKGEIISLLGENGSGKSTLLRTIGGLLPYQGSLRLFGKERTSYKRKEAAKIISFLPQARIIPNMEVEEFVCCGRFPHLGFGKNLSKADKEIVYQAMELTQILPYRQRNLFTLSGGERQKVYLAMVMAQNSEIILLDEPTTYLDIAKQFEFLELLKKLNGEGKTIIMVLHDINHALLYSDRMAVIQNGRLKRIGNREEIYESHILEEVFQVRIQEVKNETGVSYQLLPKNI